MKKLNLTIPTPCHENWDEMTQAEKGKFCGACQKTVVDFTSMSDRQLADFFKKPKTNVCGRFNEDQLEREILIPRKRIPWIRYFFQFTWPAFMLGLKSCTNNLTNKAKQVKVEVQNIKEVPLEIQAIHTMGLPIPEIVPYEKPIPKSEIIKCDINKTIGIVERSIDTTTIEEDTIITGPPLDTVKIFSQGHIRRVMGGIGYSVTVINVYDDTVRKLKTELGEQKYLAYPNPVNAGSMLTVKFPENNIPEKMQLISISGQIIATIEQDISEFATMCNINVPSHVASGVYFLRLISKNKILNTTKIVVNK